MSPVVAGYSPHKLARRDDPTTSKAAAHGDRKAHRLLILAALAGYPFGLTYTEIARVTGLEQHAVGRRLSELARMDVPLIERTVLGGKPLMRETDTGRMAHVLRVTDAGKRALRT